MKDIKIIEMMIRVLEAAIDENDKSVEESIVIDNAKRTVLSLTNIHNDTKELIDSNEFPESIGDDFVKSHDKFTIDKQVKNTIDSLHSNIQSITGLHVYNIIDSIVDVSIYTKMDIKLNFTNGPIFVNGIEKGYSIQGVYNEDKNYLNIDLITINKNTTIDEEEELIQDIRSFKTAHVMMPGFEGIDITDDKQLLRRSVFILVNNYEMFEEVYNKMRATMLPHLVVEADTHFDQLSIFRNYIKRSLTDKTLKVENRMFVPVTNEEAFNNNLTGVDDAMEELVYLNEEFERVFLGVMELAASQI